MRPTNALAVTYRLTDLRYRAGAAIYLYAQRLLLTAQQTLEQTQALQLQHPVARYRVLGGGWKEGSDREGEYRSP